MAEQEKYQPSCECTILAEVSWLNLFQKLFELTPLVNTDTSRTGLHVSDCAGRPSNQQWRRRRRSGGPTDDCRNDSDRRNTTSSFGQQNIQPY